VLLETDSFGGIGRTAYDKEKKTQNTNNFEVSKFGKQATEAYGSSKGFSDTPRATELN
jgi:hypothetical protein